MRIFSKTDIGLVRDINQDACRWGELSENCVWAVVCDGMGGENGGNIASKIAVETISDCILNEYEDDCSDESLGALIVRSIQKANDKIFKQSKEDESLAGMGTTIEAAFIRNNNLFLGHIGDSRAYIMREGKLTQITKDHSLVQELIESGEITPQQAANHPNKNLITRALGVIEDVKIDFIEASFEKDDILVLATDGLTNYISDEDMANTITQNDLSKVCDLLVDAAKSEGGSDNITVALITE